MNYNAVIAVVVAGMCALFVTGWIVDSPARGASCVDHCAAAIPATVCPLDRAVMDAKGKTIASTPTVAAGFDFNGCVASCALASCLVSCGGGR